MSMSRAWRLLKPRRNLRGFAISLQEKNNSIEAMMIRSIAKLSRASGLAHLLPPQPRPLQPPLRSFHDGTNDFGANPVALQMINYALSHARSQKSDESYAQGMLVLEQCLSSQSSEGRSAQNSVATVLLAMSSLLYERGSFREAIERLNRVEDLTESSLGVGVAAMEACIGLHLQLGQDDASSVLADKCLGLLEIVGSGSEGFEFASARAKATKGLVELVTGKVESARSCFQELQDDKGIDGNAALSYGEYLHAIQNFSLAKEFYQRVIQGVPRKEDFNNVNSLAVCNMAPDEVLVAASLALGQLESHMGNFEDAEVTLTQALTKMEELFGSNHPNVGAVLTCIALMFRNKARQERSSALLVQEGLYRRALELLKAPPVESEDMGSEMTGRDIAALARGGYAEILLVQQNRKGEGEKMRRWAEASWRSNRMSLAEALDFPEPSGKVPIIDVRIKRIL